MEFREYLYTYTVIEQIYFPIRAISKSKGAIVFRKLVNYKIMSRFLVCYLLLLCLSFQHVYCQLGSPQGTVGQVGRKRTYNSGFHDYSKVELIITRK